MQNSNEKNKPEITRCIRLLEIDNKGVLFRDILSKKDFLIQSENIFIDIIDWCRNSNRSYYEMQEIVGVNYFDMSPVTQTARIIINQHTLKEYLQEDFVIEIIEDFIVENFDKWVQMEE